MVRMKFAKYFIFVSKFFENDPFVKAKSLTLYSWRVDCKYILLLGR